jgi:CubicO group peptidase (beta-lactamase class C family)
MSRKSKKKNNKWSLVLFIAVPMLALYAYTSLQTGEKRERTAADKAVSYDPGFAPLPKGYKQAHRDSIEAFLSDKLQLDPFHGMVLIAKNGEVIFERYYGTANEKTGLKFSPETPVHVASISKVATAVAVLRLVDRHKILLDRPVRHYLPDFPYKDVTVRMLLNHRTGIPYYGYFPKPLLLPGRPMTNKRIVRILKYYKMPQYFPSNTQFAYCNTNYAVLALIVEKVTHKRFPEAMQELVFGPLKMTHSFIYEPKHDDEKIALSYNSRGELQETTPLDRVYGDKNLYTTARDLLRFDKGTYSDAFLSKAMKAEMFKGYSYERPGKANYGLGIRMREAPGKSPYFFHTGWWHGNTGCYASMREDTVCMVILSNHYTRRVFGINRLAMEFGDYPFERFAESAEEE